MKLSYYPDKESPNPTNNYGLPLKGLTNAQLEKYVELVEAWKQAFPDDLDGKEYKEEYIKSRKNYKAKQRRLLEGEDDEDNKNPVDGIKTIRVELPAKLYVKLKQKCKREKTRINHLLFDFILKWVNLD